MDDETRKYLNKRFGIEPSDILFYNSGICYSRIVVRTKESADKVSEAVQGETVNGGMLHGMPLGGITKVFEGYSIYC